jgi:hypothetical protein
MIRLALATGAVALLAPLLTAQLTPLPGVPVVPPPVPHPALAAQPLIADGAPAAVAAEPAPAGAARARPMPHPDTVGTKRDGKELKKAVAKVKALSWRDSLFDARAMSAATGKPILWLQALGDIDGFA